MPGLNPHFIRRMSLRFCILVALFGAAAILQPARAQEIAPQPPDVEATQAAESNTAKEPAKRMSLLELLMKGRWFMVPIGACSLLGLAIIIERALALRHGVVTPGQFMKELKFIFTDAHEDRDAALEYCHQHDCPIARVAAAGIRKSDRDESSIEQAIEDAGANEVAKLRRNLRMLYGVAAVAPMLGLLGTVWGMIEAFQVASTKGLGSAEHLATGIYEALVTTFAGLCVAIPVLVAYFYFMGKIEHIVSKMNDMSVDFVEHSIARAKRGGAAA